MDSYMIFRRDNSFVALELSKENIEQQTQELKNDGYIIVSERFEGEGVEEVVIAWYEEQEGSANTTKKCPECLAEIPVGASRCQHCTSKQKGDGSWLIAIVILIGLGFVLSLFGSESSNDEAKERRHAPIASESVDRTPLWYQGSKSWRSISKEGRKEILRMHQGYETTQNLAHEPSATKVSVASSTDGKQLIHATHKKYGVDPYYSTPRLFGSRMVVWLPEKAWKNFSREQKSSISTYMKGQYRSWGIGTGKIVQGSDITADRLVVKTD